MPQLLSALKDIAVLAPFERTVGDEVQGIPEDAAATYEVIRQTIRLGRWHIGIGVGEGTLGIDGAARSGSGPAFIAAREAVEVSKTLRSSFALRRGCAETKKEEHHYVSDAQAAIGLWINLLQRRSNAQWEAIDLLEQGKNGKEAARMLEISEQAFSQRRIASGYEEEKAARPLILRLLQLVHDRTAICL